MDSLGYLWIAGGDSGLYIADPETGLTVTYSVRPEEINHEIRKVFITSKSEIFLGSRGGIDSVAPYTNYKNIRISPYYPLLKPVPRGKHVWSMLEDGKYLWAGTTDYGLVRINRQTKASCWFSKHDGLSASDISSVIRDKHNRLWLPTLNGLNCLDLNNDAIYTFDEGDGTISNDYNFKAAASGPEGIIFLGTKMGLMGFDPDEVMQLPRRQPKVEITAMWISGKQYLHYLAANDTVRLNHKQNFFSFAFALPNGAEPLRYYLRYRLEGFDKDWNIIKAAEQATYTGVPPGEYTLSVQSSPDGKIWSPASPRIYLKITPAFWQTTWFSHSHITAGGYPCFSCSCSYNPLLYHKRQV